MFILKTKCYTIYSKFKKENIVMFLVKTRVKKLNVNK